MIDFNSLINDVDFEKLELILREPNIFKALSLQRKEVIHSNFIAYILNPNENHGLNDLVLKKMLRNIFIDEKARNKSLIDADYIDLNIVEIRREWKNIDILIILNEDIVLIENKVDSKDHSNQLRRYKEIVEDSFPDKNHFFVYLTPFGNEPIDKESQKYYINYSYIQVADNISSILLLYRNSISDKIYHYLNDYLITIKRELLMNDSVNDLALKLYNAHKDTFDCVFLNRPDPATLLYPIFEEEIKKRGYIIGSKNKGCIKFTTEDLNKILPKAGQWWTDKELFLFEIDYYWSDKDAIVNAIISPCDEDNRKKILDSVQTSKHFKKPGGKKWSVFFKKKYGFVASEIVNEDIKDIQKRINKILDEVSPIFDEFSQLIYNSYSLR